MAMTVAQLLELTRSGKTVVVYDLATDQTYTLHASEVAAATPGRESAPIKEVTMSAEPVVTEPVADISGLTEEELLAKINRDVAVWRAGQQTRSGESSLATSSIDDVAGYQFEPIDETAVDE